MSSSSKYFLVSLILAIILLLSVIFSCSPKPTGYKKPKYHTIQYVMCDSGHLHPVRTLYKRPETNLFK